MMKIKKAAGTQSCQTDLYLINSLNIQLFFTCLTLIDWLTRISKMSYADCFAAALAKLKNGNVLTGNPKFKQVEKKVGVLWI